MPEDFGQRLRLLLVSERVVGVANLFYEADHQFARIVVPGAYVCFVPMKISGIIRPLEQDGWVLNRTTGSHRHFSHPAKPGLVTVAGKSSAP